jgi:hypothetical protein
MPSTILAKEIFSDSRNYLKKIGLPFTERATLSPSYKEFSSGGHYGIELSSMNNFKILSLTFALIKKYKINVSRMIECRGIVRLPDAEIRDMAKICEDHQVGLVCSIGPRAISDIGGFAQSPNGCRIGYRLRGMENIIHAVEDVYRAVGLGITGFLIYDEGLLSLLNRMRADGELPKNLMFKFSVHSGCANPLSAKILVQNGADTINVVPDLSLEMLATFRQVITAPLDIFSDTAKSAGGFLRTYDMPEIIYYASPVYLKCGPISQPTQNHLPSENELEERVKQTRCVVEHIERYIPEATLINKQDETIALPNIALAAKKVDSLEEMKVA